MYIYMLPKTSSFIWFVGQIFKDLYENRRKSMLTQYKWKQKYKMAGENRCHFMFSC